MVQLLYNNKGNSLDERELLFHKMNKNIDYDGIVLKTCNRTELYKGNGFVPEDVVNHLFHVTSGLKSNFLGDTSIQGQVKEAYISACSGKNLDKSLHKLFQTALHVGKKVRSNTSISKGAVTYPNAVLEILCRNFECLPGKNITILGVHNINKKIVNCLVKKGVNTIFIGNRSYDKALSLAKEFNCYAFSFKNLKEHLSNTDVLISATSAPHTIVRFSDYPVGKEMFILDLAVPRDIDERIGLFPGATLVNIEKIESQVGQNIDKRRNEIQKARQIISDEVEKFMKKQIKEYA